MDGGRRVLGVDIDGVVNHHREHFCRLLELQTAKRLSPDAITVIPVRGIPGCDVTEADEHAVFNWPAYWVDMPVVPDAPHVLTQIRSRGIFVWLFTRRPWPNPSTFPTGREDVYHRAWRDVPQIADVTQRWLRRHGIPFDRLTLETGGDDEETRFSAARDGRVHRFVEDNPENAAALALHCDRVFLMDQPYNQASDRALPGNIVRVRTWDEIIAMNSVWTVR